MTDLPRRLPATLPQLLTEEFFVPAHDAGINIYVRNKRPADLREFSPQRTLLYVHGSTYPASTAFDLALDGWSWMDFMASRGFDVWLLDLRGYGYSTRPPAMNEPPEHNPPLVRTDTAVADIGAVVDHILAWRMFTSAAKANRRDNLTSLCRKCHALKTSAYERAAMKGDCLGMYQYQHAIKQPPLRLFP